MLFSTAPVRRRPPRGTPRPSSRSGVSSLEPPRVELLLEDVISEHSPFIRATLTRLGVPARDLEDVVQPVLDGIGRGLPAFDPSLSACEETAIRGWIFRICERQARSYHRQRKKRPEILCVDEAIEAQPDVRPTIEQRMVADERHALLGELLGLLEPDRRAVLVAYQLEEVPMAEVAVAFGIPVNTAWNRLRLALRDMRAAWRRMLAGQRVMKMG